MPLPTLQAQERQNEYTRTPPAASRNLAVRIRSIKPEFWRSTDITNLSLEDRLLFIGLWSYVDDNGVGKDELPVVVADLFAGDMFRDPRETVARVSRGLSNLFSAGLIDRYQVDGKSFLMIVQWAAHQRIDKPAKERFPRSDGDTEVIRDTLATPSRDSRDTLAPGAGEQGNRGAGEQGNRGTGEKGNRGAVSSASGTRLTDDWTPSPELLEWARAERADLDPEKQAEAFRDYWIAQPASRGRKSDWDRTFKNWIRNARGQSSGYQPKPSQSDKFHDTLALGREVQAELDALSGFELKGIA